MATQRVVIVTELAPKLKEFDGTAAMKFLKDYEAYENRIEDMKTLVTMRQCIEPGDLEALLQCSEDMEGVDVIRRGEAELHGARAELRTPRNGSPIAEMGLREELIDELGERDDDDDDAKS
jgi:hypothetical protein